MPYTVAQDDQPITAIHKIITFPKKSYAEAVAFSPDGKYFCVGTCDGFVEVYNYLTGKQRKDLAYQTSDDGLMMLESSCLSLSFSADSQKVVGGGLNGELCIWNILTGKSIRQISSAHTQGVSWVCFSKNASQVLSCSFDHTLRIHGLKSGKALKV